MNERVLQSDTEQIRRFGRLIAGRRVPSVGRMATYLVERYLPGLGVEELSAIAARASTAARELAADGVRIRYLGSTLLPADEACLCCFEADSAEAVAAANKRAGAPFARIVYARRISSSRATRAATARVPRPTQENGGKGS